MSNIISLDSYLTSFFSNAVPHSNVFNSFFSFFSLKGSSIFIWILVMLIVLIFEERKNPGVSKSDLKFLVIFSFAFILSFVVSDYALKNIFHRPRPSFAKASEGRPSPKILNFKFQISKCPSDYSFPSTHATTAFAAATVLTYFDKKRWWFYYSVAIIISYSRIYLGCHYIIDILIGALLGFIISKVVTKIKT